ncbi:unnamed protein product, partial [Ectocarpus sp. 13 AM-2016]
RCLFPPFGFDAAPPLSSFSDNALVLRYQRLQPTHIHIINPGELTTPVGTLLPSHLYSPPPISKYKTLYVARLVVEWLSSSISQPNTFDYCTRNGLHIHTLRQAQLGTKWNRPTSPEERST